jgi:hypothetical protein
MCKGSMHHFSFPIGPGAGDTRIVLGHIMPTVWFCIRCNLRDTYCGSVHRVREMSMHYFSFSCQPIVDATKSMLGHVMSNLCFHIW